MAEENIPLSEVEAYEQGYDIGYRDGVNTGHDDLRTALLEVLAYRSQVAHGSVNLTALARAMTKAEDAVRRTTIAKLEENEND